MALRWSDRRKLLYTGVASIIALVALIAIYETFFTTAPTCFDNKQDADETGVDCGGACSLLCPDVAKAPTLMWARAFQTGPTTYTAAAYIHNPNSEAGSKNVHYFFQLFDSNHSLIKEQDGTIDLPPVVNIPIVEPNINVGNRAVADTQFQFTDESISWNKIPTGSIPALTASSPVPNSDFSRVSASLTNNSLNDAKNVTVTAILFDSQGVARAASKSSISTLGARSSLPVVFTWPGGIPDIVQAQITVLPSF